MSLKGKIKADHMPVNLVQLNVPGLGAITAVTVGAIEEALERVVLPDRTAASGGQTQPVEFSITVPMHHDVEVRTLDLWYEEGKEPVSPTYKKTGTIRWPSLSGRKKRGYTLAGLFVSGRNLPEGDMSNEGEAAMIEYAMSADVVLAIG